MKERNAFRRGYYGKGAAKGAAKGIAKGAAKVGGAKRAAKRGRQARRKRGAKGGAKGSAKAGTSSSVMARAPELEAELAAELKVMTETVLHEMGMARNVDWEKRKQVRIRSATRTRTAVLPRCHHRGASARLASAHPPPPLPLPLFPLCRLPSAPTRPQALERLAGLAAEARFENGANGFAEAMVALCPNLVAQLQDLRSNLIKAACATVLALVRGLGRRFQPLAKPILQTLLKQSTQNQGRGVMAEEPRACLHAIIAMAEPAAAAGAVDGAAATSFKGFKNVVPMLVEESQNADKYMRREAAAALLGVMQHWGKRYITKYGAQVDAALAKLVTDQTSETRESARRAVLEWERIAAKRAKALIAGMSGREKKAVAKLREEMEAEREERQQREQREQLELIHQHQARTIQAAQPEMEVELQAADVAP